MATLLCTRTIPRIVRMFEMIDLMLSRKKIQKCHVVLEENLDDTGAYWEQAPPKSLHLVGSSKWSCKSLSPCSNKTYRDLVLLDLKARCQ
jgi:hypothetical protein